MIERHGQFQFFRKGSGTSFSNTFCVWFFKKNVSHVTFYWLTKFHCLVPFTSWDIRQYVQCKCLLTRLWRHFLHDQKAKTKIWIYWERKELLRWNKKHFSSILKGFQLQKNCLRPKRVPLNYWSNTDISEIDARTWRYCFEFKILNSFSILFPLFCSLWETVLISARS